MPSQQKKLISTQPLVGLGGQVAEALTKAILEGSFKGGDQLVEQELQLHFGVSRSPLREAFRELEKKGLVDILPRRGTYVKRISRTDIEEHFPVRAVLEGLAAKLAAANMNDKVLAELGATLELMKSSVAAQDTETYYKHHLRFHEIFLDCSNNALLIKTLQTLRMQNLWHRFSYHYYQERLEHSFLIHLEIFELFKNPERDLEKLRTLVEHHINIALERFLAYLKDLENPED